VDEVEIRALLAGIGISPQLHENLRRDYEISFRYERVDGPAAILQMLPGLLRMGICIIKERGRGVKIMCDFARQAQEIAAALGYNQLEVCGIAVSNAKLRRILLRLDFQISIEQLPQDLGNQTAEFLIQQYKVI